MIPVLAQNAHARAEWSDLRGARFPGPAGDLAPMKGNARTPRRPGARYLASFACGAWGMGVSSKSAATSGRSANLRLSRGSRMVPTSAVA